MKTLYPSDYGKIRIPHLDQELPQLMDKYFDEFIDLQKIADRITGCGSYLFDGQTCLDYYPEQYPKQKLLFEYSKNKKNVLEIGIYAGHSCWLMLLANLDNPDFHYTGIDICYFDFTEKCIQYLQEKYPNKITFIKGNSVDVIKTLDLDSYDLYHVDGGHDSIVITEMEYMLPRISPGKTIVFDDYDSYGPHNAININKSHLRIEAIPNCPWRNCVATVI